jgi:hypothetical protein
MTRNLKYIFSIIVVLQLLIVFLSVNSEPKKSAPQNPLLKVNFNLNIDTNKDKFVSYIENNNIIYKWQSCQKWFYKLI